jgi:hypothetical protein
MDMIRLIIIFGSIAGIILAGSFLAGYLLGADIDDHNVFVGYTIMLVALSFVFLGVKRARDTLYGGVITFGRALGVGLGIAAVAALFYVMGWEAYMAATGFTFMDAYIDSMIAAEQASGTSAADIAAMRAEMNEFAASYRNPMFRMAITFAEIAPVGLVVALASAALLRRPSFFPAKAREV